MKYLPVITIILWVLNLFGRQYVQSLFSIEYIQYPLSLLLYIFIPICFWNLCQDGKKLFPLLFLVMFMINITSLSLTLRNNYLYFNDLSSKSESNAKPELLRNLSEGKTEKERRIAARLIYWEQGLSMPFKTEDGHYHLFSPEDSDFTTYNKKQMGYSEIAFIQNNLLFQRWSILLHLVLQTAFFLIMLTYLTIRKKY